ncbi:Crp/Fnr family transcriptional regulator [Lentzea sp. NPDC059081]|uniref:Crp/Fnr family transcriptional regulator n=1 Tax=Lentzea sp. NPDC059081 TaxID=3346719 RepID=UPI0036A3B779
MTTLAALGPSAREAWKDSLLGEFPEEAVRVLLEGAKQQRLASGESIQYLWEEPGRVFLIVEGLARVYVSSESGREMTVRYVSRGEVVGLPALVAGRSNPNVGIKVMIDTEVVLLSAMSLVRIASRDARVAWPIARYVAETLHVSEQLWGTNVFQQMPPRVAYHLLELCTRQGEDLVVHATQDELARAVGSVREVVARTLKAFAREGVIERGSQVIRLLDPARLHGIASSAAV